MTPELVKQLVPFGIAGLAIIAVLLIAINPGSKTNRFLAIIAMAVIAVLVVIDRTLPQERLEVAVTPQVEIKTPSGSAGGMYWIDTYTMGDWAARDIGRTPDAVPKYMAHNVALCDENHAGFVAVCWENRAEGYSPLIDTIDTSPPTQRWCTYKDASVKISTPQMVVH